jgi:hypothetical protein
MYIMSLKQFFESVDSDLKTNREARKVYNKIKRNIDSIEFAPIMDSYIKDDKGNKHFLNGVKFNLKSLISKYDVDIFFVYPIGSSRNPFYDKQNNRLVFFTLSQSNKNDFKINVDLAKIRFGSWVEENEFIHEFTHYLDSLKYRNTYKVKNPADLESYYNSPEEYNAYTQELISYIWKNKKKLIELPYNKFYKKVFKYKKDFTDNLTVLNRRKLKKRLYKIYSDFK